MSKLTLTRALENLTTAEKKFKGSISDLKKELTESGYVLTVLAAKIGVKYSTLQKQFKTGKMPSENFKKLVSFLT